MEEAYVPMGTAEAEFVHSVSGHNIMTSESRIEPSQQLEQFSEKDHLQALNNSNANEIDLNCIPLPKTVESIPLPKTVESIPLPKTFESIPLPKTFESIPLPKTVENNCLIELCVSSWHPSKKDGNKQTYLRGCKWSPDGTCCLAVINNGGVQVLELPQGLYQGDEISEYRPIDVLDSAIKLPESGMIYDFCWFPGMNGLVPESCCWLTTRQHCPLQLWDAFDGGLRCSYRGYNAVDELEPALSTCFSADGTQIHAGYKKGLKTFDTDRPGRECVNQPINSSASSLAVSPISGSLIAVGSWSTEISLYDINEGRTKSIGKLRYHSGGVTHLQFLPDGTKIVSGARKDCKLLIWDIRFYKTPLKVLQRIVDTNQRIYFDVSRCGKYLVSGGTDGVLSTWDLSEEINTESMNSTYKLIAYPLHTDCCNGVSIHPYRPILATSSGQHHVYFEDPHIDEKDDVAMEGTTLNAEDNICKPVTIPGTSGLKNNKQVIENSLQFWWTGKSKTYGLVPEY